MSSTIQASTPPCASNAGAASAPTFASIASSDHADCPMKCNSDWCAAEARAGDTIDTIGSTLLRSQGISKPVQ